MKGRINALLLIGLIGTVVFGSHFASYCGRAVWGNSDIWWTPISMALPLHETRQKFSIFLCDELLQDHLDRGSLSATDSRGQLYQIVSDDIGVRINNWYKVKAWFLHFAVFTGIFLGLSITYPILVLIELITKRKEGCEQDA